MTGALVGLDIGVVEERLTFLDAGKCVADVRLAGANRLDFAALELDAGLVTLENVKIAERFTIEIVSAAMTRTYDGSISAQWR